MNPPHPSPLPNGEAEPSSVGRRNARSRNVEGRPLLPPLSSEEGWSEADSRKVVLPENDKRPFSPSVRDKGLRPSASQQIRFNPGPKSRPIWAQPFGPLLQWSESRQGPSRPGSSRQRLHISSGLEFPALRGAARLRSGC